MNVCGCAKLMMTRAGGLCGLCAGEWTRAAMSALDRDVLQLAGCPLTSTWPVGVIKPGPVARATR